jgi:hypothetical protein
MVAPSTQQHIREWIVNDQGFEVTRDGSRFFKQDPHAGFILLTMEQAEWAWRQSILARQDTHQKCLDGLTEQATSATADLEKYSDSQHLRGWLSHIESEIEYHQRHMAELDHLLSSSTGDEQNG